MTEERRDIGARLENWARLHRQDNTPIMERGERRAFDLADAQLLDGLMPQLVTQARVLLWCATSSRRPPRWSAARSASTTGRPPTSSTPFTVPNKRSRPSSGAKGRAAPGRIPAFGGNMQKIIDYVVLEDFPTHCLTKKVLEHMAKGWQPLGGVSSAYNGNTIKYQQAMVRYQS